MGQEYNFLFSARFCLVDIFLINHVFLVFDDEMLVLYWQTLAISTLNLLISHDKFLKQTILAHFTACLTCSKWTTACLFTYVFGLKLPM